jgi:hypothetical protein
LTELPRALGRARTALRLSPLFGRNLVHRPYREAARPMPLGQRCRLAAYDTFLALLLAGIEELTGHVVRDEAGNLAVLVNRVAFLLDDQFEMRVGRDSVDFDEILQTTPVGAAVRDMRVYLFSHCPHERVQRIRNTLWRAVRHEYQRYSESALRRSGPPTLIELLADAELDSGAVLRQLAEVVALFEGFDLEPEVAAEFQTLGVACKFADDLRDWWPDEQTGTANIMSVCLRQWPEELHHAITTAKTGRRMHEARWLKGCPHAFTRFRNLYAEHYTCIHSTNLRIAADLMMETGRLGLTPDRSGSSAARLNHGPSI